MIDKQVRDALIEYKCKCMRMDKVKIPFVGGLLSVFGGRWGYLPRMHLVAARVGDGQNAVVAERWMYRGDELHHGYDTRQVFRTDYPDGAHSVYYRARPRPLTWWQRMFTPSKPPPRPAPKPKRPLVALVEKLPPDRRLAFMRQHPHAFN